MKDLVIKKRTVINRDIIFFLFPLRIHAKWSSVNSNIWDLLSLTRYSACGIVCVTHEHKVWGQFAQDRTHRAQSVVWCPCSHRLNYGFLINTSSGTACHSNTATEFAFSLNKDTKNRAKTLQHCNTTQLKRSIIVDKWFNVWWWMVLLFDVKNNLAEWPCLILGNNPFWTPSVLPALENKPGVKSESLVGKHWWSEAAGRVRGTVRPWLGHHMCEMWAESTSTQNARVVLKVCTQQVVHWSWAMKTGSLNLQRTTPLMSLGNK